MQRDALNALHDLDINYPEPAVFHFLSRPENSDYLEYVYRDPFGCHVFPGDIAAYPRENFFADMQKDISSAKQIHLWAYIPTCRYRCHFCQYPTVILNPAAASSQQTFSDLVDYNIREARLWLEKIPALASAEIGEFNIFGGTPSLLPAHELRRLMSFYRENFNFSAATLRFEGEPGTLDRAYLQLLKALGFSKISFGMQSFDDRIIAACGRKHSASEGEETIRIARELGIDWVSVDLIYGMLGQSVSDVEADMQKTLQLELSHVVCTKLHMEEFSKARTGVSGERQSLWQKKGIMADDMIAPGLGKQYQMREVIERYLSPHYHERPTMYFHQNHREHEQWKSLITDLDKQYPEVAIGLGGSSKCAGSEAINITDYTLYKQSLDAGQLPIGESRGISSHQGEVNAFKMALSTLIPVDNAIFKQRFNGKSFYDNSVIAATLARLQRDEMVRIQGDVVTLTPMGITLVEAIINTQFEW